MNESMSPDGFNEGPDRFAPPVVPLAFHKPCNAHGVCLPVRTEPRGCLLLLESFLAQKLHETASHWLLRAWFDNPVVDLALALAQ